MSPSNPKSQALIARFEPARAVLRPKSCDEREECWVKIGAAGYDTRDSHNRCRACLGSILIADLENEHAAALTRCLRAQGKNA